MTYKEFRQLCDRANHAPLEPQPDPAQLKALVDVKIKNRKNREKLIPPQK